MSLIVSGISKHCDTNCVWNATTLCHDYTWNTTAQRQYMSLEHHDTAPVPVPGTPQHCASTCAWNITTLRQRLHMCLEHHDAASAHVPETPRRCVSTCTWNTTALRQHLYLEHHDAGQHLCLEHHDTAPAPVPGHHDTAPIPVPGTPRHCANTCAWNTTTLRQCVSSGLGAVDESSGSRKQVAC